jgi:hypothetical protein
MSQKDVDRYLAAAHAMQTGVAYQMQLTAAHEPKHLRVGVNSALVNSAALATLLIEKGVFTLDEYEKALADAMEREVVNYEKDMPPGVTLR